MRAAIIENDIVVNVAEADAYFAEAQGWIASDVAKIGDLWDGETFTSPPSPPPPVPKSVSMRQARLALLNAGLLDDVEAAIITMDEAQRAQTQIEWEYAQEVQRDNALVAALGPKLGLDDAAIDSLFSMAATL